MKPGTPKRLDHDPQVMVNQILGADDGTPSGAPPWPVAGMPATGVAIADDGTVAETLIRLAREQDAAAIAVGAHSRRGLRRMALGSTSKELVERAPCPVIVVPNADTGRGARPPSTVD